MNLITPGQEQMLREAEGKIRDFGKLGVRAVLSIGKELSRVKAVVPCTQLMEWAHDRFGWGENSVRSFINVYATFGSANSADLEPIDVSALYLLARPSTAKNAPDLRDKLLGEARQGARITHERVRRELDQDREGRGDPAAPATPRTPTKVAELISRLREFDLADEAADELAEMVEPSLCPALAAKCYRVAGWLTDLARGLDGIAMAA